jgi:hypothetical protein
MQKYGDFKCSKTKLPFSNQSNKNKNQKFWISFEDFFKNCLNEHFIIKK